MRIHDADAQRLVSTAIGRFSYARYSYRSDALQALSTFGVLTPTHTQDIRGTIYFLHGGDGDDEQWIQAGLEACIGDHVMHALIDRGIQIVLPSIGLSFLRAPAQAALPSPWDALTLELMPAVEEETTTSAETRWITGISMGGCAALSAFLRTPDQYAGCGSHFPGLVDFDVFDDSALQRYAAQTGIDDGHRAILAQCFRGAFADAADWRRHDPIALARRMHAEALDGKNIYMDVGAADEFALHLGVARLASELAMRGIACESHVIPDGRHDAAFVQGRYDHMLRAVIGV